MQNDRGRIEAAFHGVREELGVRTTFPVEVLEAADEMATRAEWQASADREDLGSLPFVTIDPPGSQDLDQAVFFDRTESGPRVRYAIADVAAFVDRGTSVEEEAWRRGVTFYSPDRRDPLYPPALGQAAASLLPDGERPANVFDLQLDHQGELIGTRIVPARIRSRAQLTYHQALDHIQGDGALFRAHDFAESLMMLREVGELRIERERARGGVSLPILDQHVERSAAHRLGYELVYETPNIAESWNAQISLLAGHAAALRMGIAGIGLLRTMPPPRDADVDKLRVVASALGFHWPIEISYGAFLHSISPTHPNLQVLVWQARRLMRGAGYQVFDEALDVLPMHSAIALPYAHCTAPLRRLADRYVLELLVALEAGYGPGDEGVAKLKELPSVMGEAAQKSGRLERRVLDIAEAWELRDRVGDRFQALVLDSHGEDFEGQLRDLPVRAKISRNGWPEPPLGAEVEVELTSLSLEQGSTRFDLVSVAD